MSVVNNSDPGTGNMVYDMMAVLQWNLAYPDPTYPDYSLIQTPVWEPIPIPQQKVPHLYGNSVIRTVSLGTEVSE